MPFSVPHRLAVLAAFVVAVYAVAAIPKKTRSFASLVVFLGMVLPVLAVAWMMAAPVLLPFQSALTMSRLQPIRRFLASFHGKMATWAGVLASVVVIAVTANGPLLTAESSLLVLLMVLSFVGFLHTAANPLQVMEAWQAMQIRVIGWIRGTARRMDRSAKPAPFVDRLTLVPSAAFAVVQRARVESTVTDWRHLWAFVAWLVAAIAVSVLAFAGVFDALLKLVPLPGFSLTTGFWSRVSLSITIVGGLDAPKAFLYPFSTYTVVVAAELMTAVYFIGVAVTAFSTMSREGGKAMRTRLSQNWTREIDRCVTELRAFMPPKEIESEVNKAAAGLWHSLGQSVLMSPSIQLPPANDDEPPDQQPD
jgi:hypothetical protein